MIQAPDGRRMSKSLGTGIDPLEEIDRSGADAVRFGLLAMSSTQDVRYSAEKIAQGEALANKLYNAARFAILADRRAAPAAPRRGRRPVEDRWILSRLAASRGRARRADRALRLRRAPRSALYDFVYGELCDWYIELVKPRLDEPRAARDAALRAAARRCCSRTRSCRS